jgi:hypothetical protein
MLGEAFVIAGIVWGMAAIIGFGVAFLIKGMSMVIKTK